jgi:pro-apoptotic serine protease NMA111
LNRVVRAVEYVKRGEEVPRGTLQTEFMHHSYDELRRMGLKEDVEVQCRQRNADAHGLLAVSKVLRGGPACPNRKSAPAQGVKGLEPGDIIYTCNGVHITDFVGLWEIIDDAVGQEIVLEVFRSGNQEPLTVSLTVQNLHSITPNRFLEIGGAVIHDLSYQVGRNHNVQLGTGVICVGQYFSNSVF